MPDPQGLRPIGEIIQAIIARIRQPPPTERKEEPASERGA